jgi:hypothetical protein
MKFYIFIILLNLKQTKFIIIKLSKMKTIKKLQNQIKALNKKLELNQAKNVYAVMGKIKKLKEQLQVEIDNHNWESYLSE